MFPTPMTPLADCRLCPRLADFRSANGARFPHYFNGPVPSFGDADPWLMVVGLAPGLHGANQTGRPFTGDYAGDLLYATLRQFGLAQGVYDRRPDDGLTLQGCRIVNAVRCVPPENKPTPQEIRICQPFLASEIAEAKNLKAIIALGTIAHDSVVRCFGLKKSACRFAHGASHDLAHGITLFDSYHCSRYNTNTRRLTPEMFHAVFALAEGVNPARA